ncbi:MAG: 4Fe-4S binding protein [Anaerolineae bacterium]
MRIGAMLGDLGRSLFTRPITEKYPSEHKNTPALFRGKLQYDASKCTGCRLCMRDCPSKAIEIVVIDKANKRYAMKYDVGSCIFCGQCQQSCRFGSLDFSSVDWELASGSKASFAEYFGADARS